VRAVRVEGGTAVTVRHRLAGRVSRASLVYEWEGARRTLDEATNCRRSLEAGGIQDDGESCVVELSGQVPEGATDVRLVLVDETGTRSLPVALG
ncbi:MAG: hypothetical protein ACREID_08770, partial [Planctomycetota bacterium]